MSHVFEVEARWKEGFRGEATPDGVPFPVPFAVPKEFGGPGGEWTPEHFLASAVNTCVMATFLSIAKASKLEIAGYVSRATCTMDKGEGGFRITGIALTPVISVASEKDRERAARMIEKAEKICPISASMKPPVTLQASIEVKG
jgi:organic hydroperoxide reductase OsmC/OhrA